MSNNYQKNNNSNYNNNNNNYGNNNWNNQRPNQGTKTNSQNYPRNNNNELNTAGTPSTTVTNPTNNNNKQQKNNGTNGQNQKYQQQYGQQQQYQQNHNRGGGQNQQNYSNGGQQQYGQQYQNNRNNQQSQQQQLYQQQQFYQNSFIGGNTNNNNNMQQYSMWNQTNGIAYNGLNMYPGNNNQNNQNNDYGMSMWDMNGFVPNINDISNQSNFPSLTAQFPPPIYITANGVDLNADTIESIPDSSELERRLIEDQMKETKNKTNNQSQNQQKLQTSQQKQQLQKDQKQNNTSNNNSQGGQIAKQQQQQQQQQEFNDVNMLFSQMNVIGNILSSDQKENQIMIRTKQGVYLMDYDSNQILDESNKISSWNAYSFFIQDGHYIICADSTNIGVYSSTKKKLLDHKKMNDIQTLILSPLQNYLVCIEKPNPNTDDIKLQILDALNLQIHKELDYNFFSKSRMNLIMFDKNENNIFIREKKEIKIYSTSNFELVNTVNAENFVYQYLSPSSDQQQLLLLTPEFSKGYEMIPAQLKLFNLSDLSTCILNQSISKSQEVIPVWSPDGKNLLIWCSTIKDDTGNTYYGQHIVYKYQPSTQSIEQLNFYKGVIHDIKWQPNSENFVVIGGGMPSHSVLFNKEGVPVFEFGRHHINKCNWSPYSKLLFLSGFGNLGGDIEVWNVQDFKKLGQFKAHCTVSSQWSYDGTKILCGVLFPKLRVQNNFKVFDVYGTLCKHSDYSSTDLYEVCWQPYPFPEERPIEKKSPTNNNSQQSTSTNDNSNSADTPDSKNNNSSQPKKGILTKRGNLSSMLNEAKITNHGGKILQSDETFAREEDKEMELVKQSTTQKKQDQGIMFQRNQNKFVEQPKPLTEEEELAIEREKKQQKQQQKKALKLPNPTNDRSQQQNTQQQQQQQQQQQKQNQKNISSDKNSGKGSSNSGRTSPELDDFFDQTDEVNDKDRVNIQPIGKKN